MGNRWSGKKATPEEIQKKVDSVWEQAQTELVGSIAKVLAEPQPNFSWDRVPQLDQPINPATGHIYQGMNKLRLDSVAMHYLHQNKSFDNRFVGFSQAKKLGLKMKKGSKGIPILVYKTHGVKKESDPKTGEKVETIYKLPKPFRSYHFVFHISSFENAPPPPAVDVFLKNTSPFVDHVKLDQMISNVTRELGVELVHSGKDQAFFNRQSGIIHLPHKELFNNRESYYSVAFHELSHATAVDTVVGRPYYDSDHDYAVEELVAEISAHMLRNKTFMIDAPPKLDANYINTYLNQCNSPANDLMNAVITAEKTSNRIIELSGMKPELEMYRQAVEEVHSGYFEIACENLNQAELQVRELKLRSTIDL